MKKMIVWLRLLCKRQLKKFSLYFVIALMIFTCLGLRYAATNFAISIEIGVTNMDDGIMAKRIVDNMKGSDGLVKFVEYDTEEELVEAVQGSKVFGGYIIKKDFTSKIMQGDTKETIEVISTPNNIVIKVANEIFFSYVMEEFSYEELVRDTINTGYFDDMSEEEIREELRESFETNLTNGTTFALDYEHAPKDYNGKAININVYDYITPIVAGIVGLMIFLGGLCGTINYFDDRQNKSFVLLKSGFKQLVALIEIAIPVFIITIVGIVMVMVVDLENNLLYATGKYMLYALLVVVYCFILKTVIRSKPVFVSFIPVMIMLSLIFCPVYSSGAFMSGGLSKVGMIVPLYWLYVL